MQLKGFFVCFSEVVCYSVVMLGRISCSAVDAACN